MTRRQAQDRATPQASGRVRAAGLLGIGLAAVLLAGCTSDFLVDGGAGAAPGPTESAAPVDPTPTETVPAEDPNAKFDCVNLLIDRPGNYVIGECGRVTLQGSGIRVTFTSINQLVIRGDGVELVGETLGSVEIQGQRAEIEALDVGGVEINGDDNIVTVETTIDTVTVQGNRNVVSAGDGIQSPPVDNGLDNELS